MTTLNRTGRVALIISLLGTTAAYADVTAQDVWGSFQENMSLYGESSLSVGGESMSGDTLTVSDVTLTIADDEATVVTELGDLTFTEMGDGTVSVGMAAQMPMTVTVDPTYATPITVNVSLGQEGVDLIVGGTPEEMSYDLTAARYVVSVDSVEGEGAEVQVNAAEISISDVVGAYTLATTDALQNVDYALSAGSVAVAVDISEPGGEGAAQFLGTIDGLETNAVAAVPTNLDMDSPENAFVDGLAMEAGYSFGATNYTFNFVDGRDDMNGSASAESGQMSISVDSTGFSYSGGATAPSVAFEGAELPFPVEVSMAEYGYGVTVPLAASEEAESFAVNLLIADLAVNEAVWSMVDPGGILSHDPATVSLDVSGLVKLAYDVLDPSQMGAMMMADVPGEIYELNINDLTLRAAGAEVMGSGAFTFDNSDLATFGGVPRPEGSAALEINGANQLIDKLVQMGLLPEEQVMGARMMMGMFAQVVGDDMMRSELEVNAEGHVIVNGQRIQ